MDPLLFDGKIFEHELKCRVSLFGAGGVGKTKFVNRIMYNKYTETYVPTVEEYYETIEEYAGIRLILEFVDTSGTEQFPAMRKYNIQKSNLVLLFYDVSNANSINEVKRLYKICREYSCCNIIVVGAKADFLPEPTPTKQKSCVDEMIAYVLSTHDSCLHHLLCSARTCQGVEQVLENGLTSVFETIASHLDDGSNLWSRIMPQLHDPSHAQHDPNSRLGIRCMLKHLKKHLQEKLHNEPCSYEMRRTSALTQPKIHQRERRSSSTVLKDW